MNRSSSSSCGGGACGTTGVVDWNIVATSIAKTAVSLLASSICGDDGGPSNRPKNEIAPIRERTF